MERDKQLDISDIYGEWTLKLAKEHGTLRLRFGASNCYPIGNFTFDKQRKEVSFTYTDNKDGTPICMDFEGIVSGDNIKGIYVFRPGYFKKIWSATKGGPE